MGKDLASKNLLNCTDVFADIGNVILFHGEELLSADSLEPQPTELTYKDNHGAMRGHQLDTRMKATKQEMDIAIFCMENQSEVSQVMPVRDMGYQYSNYNEQIRQIQKKNENEGIYYTVSGIGKSQKLIPVISIILYYGTEEWDGPEKLSDMFSIPEKWKEKLSPWIAEHPIHVVNIASQDESVRAKYKSDFRYIVDFLACAGDREKIKEYISDKNRVIRHTEEYLDMMEAFSSKGRFSQIKENIINQQKTGKDGVDMTAMDVVLDEIEKMGMERGIEQGIEQGISQGKREIILNMLRDGQKPELISKYTNESLDNIYQLADRVKEITLTK